MGWGYLSLHILSAGMWSACAITEELAAKMLDGPNNEIRKALAKLQYWSDLVVALPAAVVLNFTGDRLMWGRMPTKLMHAMAGVGAVAFLFKIAALPYVVGRHRAALEDDWERFERNEKWARRLGRGAVHSVLVGLGIGIIMSRED